MKHLKLFETLNQYENFKLSDKMVLPNVSYCTTEGSIFYNSVNNNIKHIAYYNVQDLDNNLLNGVLLQSLGGIKSLKLNGEYLDLKYETVEEKTYTYEDVMANLSFDGDSFLETVDSLGNTAYYLNNPTSIPYEMYAFPDNQYIFDENFKIEDYAVAQVFTNHGIVVEVYCEPLEFYNNNALTINGNVITISDGLKSILYDNPKSASFYGDNIGLGLFFYNMYKPSETYYSCNAKVISGPPFYEEKTFTSTELFDLLEFSGDTFTTSATTNDSGEEVTLHLMNMPINCPKECTFNTSSEILLPLNTNFKQLYAMIAANGSWLMQDLLLNMEFLNVQQSSENFIITLDEAWAVELAALGTIYIIIYDALNPTEYLYTITSNIEIQSQGLTVNEIGEYELEIEFSSNIIPYYMFSSPYTTMKYFDIFSRSLTHFNDDFFVGMKTIPLLVSGNTSLDLSKFEVAPFSTEESDDYYNSYENTSKPIYIRYVPIGIDNSTTNNILTSSLPHYEARGGKMYSKTINLIDNNKVTKLLFVPYVEHYSHRDFMYYHNLTNVILPNTFTTVDLRLLNGCDNLTSLTLSDSVTYVVSFYNQSKLQNLKQIICKAITAPTLEPYSSFNVSSTGTLYYPKGSDYSTWIEILPDGWTYMEI